ncbi:ParB-like nuclease family protein [Actinocrispum wychmicini]|uniref:ParB-like nuclease family protein n=1 Tax=Actinocrispum wychmicini TaxID=1213861 RepID=A0A4R2IMD0_9PSEU|nr:ParB-like nuclease family protein [Actinocrispum wychmicini]
MERVECVIASLVTYRSWVGCCPPRPVEDPGKVALLRRQMDERGWNGPPVVMAGDRALTGTHRLAAVAGSRLTVIPVVDAHALGACWIPQWREVLPPISQWCEIGHRLGDLLPPEVVSYVGLDLHLPSYR